MLILDKQRAVERMLALTAGEPAAEVEARALGGRGRGHARIAAYERRASIEATPSRRAERATGVLQPAGGAPSWY
jgi:SLT domain-containing protein